MPRFDWIKIGNGPVTVTCRSCGHRDRVDARSMQQTVDRHRCGRTTKNSGR
ncbi:hypothetical protein [Streptomyces sp. NBC_01361]|uniref:hypothetical protein n=1 Tax=Streptomyces sp. NBC_01361 TaxID=2903838 RepID=UPI002E35420D|nr:hypothetical protein [Streptomyces sp. NBC_01361]